ncbi:unnamed protein product [Thlaspi arvense]|uniref:Uncharacterized protein n=1 Tax=Thlaspi arvense TaxID=13288 RepID=A0AAU9S2C1_THLAR|nr:unnamed protein product [Thlaspi arvense]
MRPPSTAAATAATPPAAAAGVQRWNSPIAYLLGSLGLMLGVVALALVILVCTFKRSRNSSIDTDKMPARPVPVMPLEMEPRIVVIMAGDENPTYLAKPVSPNRHAEPA